MKLNFILFIMLLAATMQLNAQHKFTRFLDSIAVNNRTIATAKQNAEATKLGASTGIYLSNATVSYDRLNNSLGSYSEMLVTQSFDFPTVYGQKGNIAELTAQQADEYYRLAKLDVFIEATGAYTQMISLNRKISTLHKHQQMMDALHTGSEKKLQTGESNIFEAGRIRTEAAKLKSEIQLFENRRMNLQITLIELNGGNTLTISDTVYPELLKTIVPDSICATITKSHPQTNYWQSQLLIAEHNVKLQQALSLPKFEVGYRNDINTGQVYNGIHAGISIPLFENKNTIRAAKAQQVYTNSALETNNLNVEYKIRQFVSEYAATQKTVSELSQVLESLNTIEYLHKAFDVGQINYTEFFLEYSNYFQFVWYVEDLKQKEIELQLQLFVLLSL